MGANTFGLAFAVTTFGESHGPAIGCVIDGCPPGLKLDLEYMQAQLSRRATGRNRHTSQRKEPDHVEVLSGLFEGQTTGTPIALLIHNRDARSKDYSAIKNLYRPGHADFTYDRKYGVRDYRGGGRSSARETTMRVAAGAVARQYLDERYGVQVRGFVSQLGPFTATTVDWNSVADDPFFFPDPSQREAMEAWMDDLRREGDSIGARVYVEATGVPAGLGEPVYGKLDAELASALMSINAVKGVEIGAGFRSVEQRGSEHRDEITPAGFLSNHAGGVLGGISTGQDVTASIALKPTSSIRIPGRTVDRHGAAHEVVTQGRHDPCVGIRAVPIAEAMLALVLMDHLLRDRAQNFDLRKGTT